MLSLNSIWGFCLFRLCARVHVLCGKTIQFIKNNGRNYNEIKAGVLSYALSTGAGSKGPIKTIKIQHENRFDLNVYNC